MVKRKHKPPPRCLFEPASHDRMASLIMEEGPALSWAVPSLPRPRHCLGRVKPVLCSSLGTGALGPCLAWMPTLHEPTSSTLHSGAPSAGVRVVHSFVPDPWTCCSFINVLCGLCFPLSSVFSLPSSFHPSSSLLLYLFTLCSPVLVF